ncbi:hypothetical protein ACFFRR_003975 [Megaselia abdita]
MNINDLIKSRLQEIPSNVQPLNSLPSKNGFSIPKLNLPVFGGTIASPPSTSLELSLQKIRDAGAVKSNGVEQAITEKLGELVISPDIKSIDLTSAINSKEDAIKPIQKRTNKDKGPEQDPLETENISSFPIEFCEPDISKFRYGLFCREPSTFGKIICVRFRRYSAKRIKIDHGFHPKHSISRFNFNTKSPDDIVISKNSKIKL